MARVKARKSGDCGSGLECGGLGEGFGGGGEDAGAVDLGYVGAGGGCGGELGEEGGGGEEGEGGQEGSAGEHGGGLEDEVSTIAGVEVGHSGQSWGDTIGSTRRTG